jgi:23S rRNA (cytosine1962-C5)-methyltransferase
VAKLYLKKNEEHRIKNGHLWVFSNEIKKLDGEAENGDIVEVLDSTGHSLGSGFYNKNSLISVRLFAPFFSGDIFSYLKTTLEHAYSLRKRLYPHRNSFRIVFSESDFIPGLIIDKYNDTYVMQVYSLGMRKYTGAIADILKNEYKAVNIFTMNEPYFRKLEGLPETDEILYGEMKDEIIDDGKVKYRIDFSSSQKTGFYFDQCDNREFIERFVEDRSVLDSFCNSGGFGMHAVIAGADSVTFVDSSETEITNARFNYESNNLTTKCEFITKDVFDYLDECNQLGRKFDIVMLDPPAFARSKKSLPSALKGYIKLNKLALNCISEDGFLVNSSCSHHVKRNDFLNAVNSASVKSGRKLQLIHFSGASMDHPSLPAMEETSYLKFSVFRVY